MNLTEKLQKEFESMRKLKRALCLRCGHEASVEYKDKRNKICLKCFSDGILEYMHLVPEAFINLDNPPTVESDYQDWIDEDGLKQEEL